MNQGRERDIIRRGFTFRTAALCLLAAGLLTGRCSKSSNPSSSSSSISGAVTLEQSTGHAGVTVRLYHPPEFDPDLVGQQDQHPSVGVPITPRMLFDHRGASFTASTETGADGSYAFSGVAEGEYIVVAEMEGYGHQARFDISVREGRDAVVDPISLLQEMELSGELTTGTVLEANRHYLVTGDVTVPAGATVTIEAGAQLRFTGYYTIYVAGQLTAVGSSQAPIIFTSGQPVPAKDDWRRIEFDAGGQGSEMRWCRVEYANNGIYAKGVPLTLSHNVVRHNAEYGVLVFSTFEHPVTISNHLLLENDTGLWAENSSQAMITNNISWQNGTVGIGCQDGTPQMSGNLCSGSEYGLYIIYDASPDCRNNRLVHNDWGLACGGRSRPTIRLCDFEDNVMGGIHVLTLPHGARAQPTINFCNFDETNELIRVSGYPNAPNDLDIDATNNYWSGLSIEEIDQLIWDKNDVTADLVPHVATVNYLPMQSTRIDSAGLP